MHNLVHVSVNGSVWWEKTSDGWRIIDALDANAKSPVWVVTDLAEETFTEIKVPRVFGSDRANYIRRQLANRFPDSVFRIALPAPQAGGLMDRLAPPSQILTAVEPADRVELALAHIKAPVAGVWTTSMLMARMGQRASMPAHLFVVLIQPGGMRILFIKHRVPVLTRMITAPLTDVEQAAEIIRTLRHLENTHMVERSKERYGLLLMGGNAVLQAKLIEDRLTVLALPNRWNVHEGKGNWSHILFDLAIKTPQGQLAPLKYRIGFLVKEVKKFTRLSSIFFTLTAIGLVSLSAVSAIQAQRTSTALKQQIHSVGVKVTAADAEIAVFGVSPDFVRKAIALDTDEVINAPDMHQHIASLSHIIGSMPDVRIKSWHWRVLEVADVACTKDITSASSSTEIAETGLDSNPEQMGVRKVEMQMTVTFAEGSGPSLLLQQTENISSQIKKWKGALVIRDPALSLRKTNISIASLIRPQSGSETGWCVSVPIKIKEQP